MKEYRTPKGTQDILPTEVAKWHKVEELIYSVCYYYGYNELRTPIFEDTGVFKRENDSSDMVNKEMYTFSPNGEDSYTLRPEGTAGIVRSFVQHKLYGTGELPAKLYYLGPMFRHERPQKGRYRQFVQFGIENIGVKSPLIDAEMIALGVSVVKGLGLSQVKVLINTLGDKNSRDDYREKLKEYFKDSVSELCGDCQRRFVQNPLRLLDCKVDGTNPIMKSVPLMKNSLTDDSSKYFEQVLNALDSLSIEYEIDDKLVRGLDYYTDTVFEVVSTHPESGAQATVFAGGRYDNLVEYFGGPSLSGVGFAMGLERLLILAEAEGVALVDDEGKDVYVMSLGEVGSVPLEIAIECRANGYKAEFNCQPRGLKAQFKAVDRHNAKVAIIVGEEELKDNKVNVKNTMTGEQVTVNIEDVIITIDSILNAEDK